MTPPPTAPIPYLPLLDRYDRMIRHEPWWDGHRDALVREMDRVWDRLTAAQRAEVLAYAELLYQKGMKS